MIIGGTLAAHGVLYPATRLQIITRNSVKTMLKDWSSIQNVKASFHQDQTVASIKRFYSIMVSLMATMGWGCGNSKDGVNIRNQMNLQMG